MACTECRRRKLKCDEARPECGHCTRRNRRQPGRSACEYDEIPRKRGRDRYPGSRLAAKGRSHLEDDDTGLAGTSSQAILISPGVRRSKSLSLTTIHMPDAASHLEFSIPSEPSLDFTRKSWWDHLLWMYSPDRAIAARQITADLRHLFVLSDHWFALINVPLFMENFHSPVRRENMQPSVVLAGLALAVMVRSSETRMGSQGRAFALKLRDTAQAALEASINAQWITHSLAQAAWALALFEFGSHPEYSLTRAMSSLKRLDAILAALHPAFVHVVDASAFLLSPHSVPTHPRGGALTDAASAPKHRAALINRDPPTTVAVAHLEWDAGWTLGEIQREEIRRICWSSLKLGAAHLGFHADSAKYISGLALVQSAKYGPRSSSTVAGSQARSPPIDSISALLCQSMLLLLECMSRSHGERDNNDGVSKAELVYTAWDELLLLEDARKKETSVDPSDTYIWLSAQYLFFARIIISEEYNKYVSHSAIGFNAVLDRQAAEQWLNTQRKMPAMNLDWCRRNVRPDFIWAQLHMVSICYLLWQKDHSLIAALEVARMFVYVSEYMGYLWPCAAQEAESRLWRERITGACLSSGLEPPDDFRHTTNITPPS